MWEFIKPTKLKFNSTITIVISYWVVNWLKSKISIIYFQSMNPEYFENIAKSFVPQMKDTVNNNSEALINAGLHIFYMQVAISILVSYMVSCILILIYKNKTMQSNKKFNMDSGADAPPPVN